MFSNQLSLNSWAGRIFLGIVAVDIILILLHVFLIFTPWVSDFGFYLGNDTGFGEFYQYAKLIGVITLISSRFVQCPAPLYLYWVGMFTYYLMDDAMQVHETVGGYLADTFATSTYLSLSPQDLGELGVYFFAGVFFLATLIPSYHFSDKNARQFSHFLILSVIALVFFGGIVDVLSSTMTDSLPFLQELLIVVEDGGELLVISVVLWFLLQPFSYSTMSAPGLSKEAQLLDTPSLHSSAIR